MKRIIVLVITAITALTGCNSTVTCFNQYITPAFIGFSLSDLDTVIVRQYEKGDNFIHPVDTAIISLDTIFLKSTSAGDTTFVLLNHISGQEKYIFPGHDWQIYIPAQNQTISISSIVSPQTEITCFKCSCRNPINSFIQNTQTIIPQTNKIPNLGGDFYLTYIRR